MSGHSCSKHFCILDYGRGVSYSIQKSNCDATFIPTSVQLQGRTEGGGEGGRVRGS